MMIKPGATMRLHRGDILNARFRIGWLFLLGILAAFVRVPDYPPGAWPKRRFCE